MKPTGSKMGLFLACQFPFNGQEWPAQTAGRPAQMGQAYHAVVAKLVNVIEPPASTVPPGLLLECLESAGLAPEDLSELEAMHPESAAGMFSAVRAEKAFAWDYRTGEVVELGEDIGRNYRLEPYELAGTADIVGIRNGALLIADWKTGREAPPAKNNAQLMFLAMCANKLADFDEIELCIGHVVDGKVWPDYDTVTRFDLDIFEAELKAVLANPKPEPKPGTHCRYCPVLATCPKALETLAEKDDEYPLALRGIDSIQSPQHAEWLLHRIDAAEELLSSVKAKVREYADANGAFELSNGKKWGPYVVVRETIQGSREKLIEVGIPESLIEYSVAKGDVEKFAKEGAERGQGAAAVRAMFEKLRDVGCVKESMFTKYEARK